MLSTKSGGACYRETDEYKSNYNIDYSKRIESSHWRQSFAMQSHMTLLRNTMLKNWKILHPRTSEKTYSIKSSIGLPLQAKITHHHNAP